MSRDADSFYVEDCRQAQTNTQAIQNLTGQISRLIGTIETDKDLQYCGNLVESAVRQASETQGILKRIQEHQRQAQNPSERSNRRMMYHKLSDNLAITARVLEDVVRRFTLEEQRAAADCKISDSVDDVDSGAGLGFGRRGSNCLSTKHAEDQPLQQAGALLADADENALSRELQEERCQALKQVDEDMRCLQRIYADLACAVDEQQSSFDTLENHMACAVLDIERGREEIQKTHNKWGVKLRQNVWAMTGGLACIAVITFVVSS